MYPVNILFVFQKKILTISIMQKFNFPSSIIAGANLFSCSFFTVFAIKALIPNHGLSTSDLLLIQGSLSIICHLMKVPLLIGIGIAPWLYLNQSSTTHPIQASDYSLVFLTCAFCFIIINFKSWIDWMRSYLIYQPGTTTACCFSALLLYSCVHNFKALTLHEGMLSAVALAVLIIFDRRHQHYGPFFVFITLTALTSSMTDHSIQLPFNKLTFDIQGIFTHPLMIVNTALFLFSIMLIDISTCMMALTPVLNLEPSEIETARKTQVFNNLIVACLGSGQALIYFENLILKSYSKQDRLRALLVSGLIFLSLALMIEFLNLNIQLLSTLFSSYLFYMVFKSAFGTKKFENGVIFTAALTLFYATTFNYIQILCTVSILSHLFGKHRQEISINELKKNNVFCLIVFTLNFILKH